MITRISWKVLEFPNNFLHNFEQDPSLVWSSIAILKVLKPKNGFLLNKQELATNKNTKKCRWTYQDAEFTDPQASSLKRFGRQIYKFSATPNIMFIIGILHEIYMKQNKKSIIHLDPILPTKYVLKSTVSQSQMGCWRLLGGFQDRPAHAKHGHHGIGHQGGKTPPPCLLTWMNIG